MEQRRKPVPVVSQSQREVKLKEELRAAQKRERELRTSDRRKRAQRVGKVIAGGGFIRLIFAEDPLDELLRNKELLTEHGKELARIMRDHKETHDQVKHLLPARVNKKLGVGRIGLTSTTKVMGYLVHADEEQCVDFIARELGAHCRWRLIATAYAKLTDFRYRREVDAMKELVEERFAEDMKKGFVKRGRPTGWRKYK